MSPAPVGARSHFLRHKCGQCSLPLPLASSGSFRGLKTCRGTSCVGRASKPSTFVSPSLSAATGPSLPEGEWAGHGPYRSSPGTRSPRWSPQGRERRLLSSRPSGVRASRSRQECRGPRRRPSTRAGPTPRPTTRPGPGAWEKGAASIPSPRRREWTEEAPPTLPVPSPRAPP